MGVPQPKVFAGRVPNVESPQTPLPSADFVISSFGVAERKISQDPDYRTCFTKLRVRAEYRATQASVPESALVNVKPPQAICPSILVLLALGTAAQLLARNEQKNWSHPARQDTDRAAIATGNSPCTDQSGKDDRQREDQAILNLPSIARFWLTEDVVYLISREERRAFLDLATDQERNQFIEQFWLRRAPDPRSLENAFKEEHYRRIVFANEKYGMEISGWKTDRGRVYLTIGPPDSIESQTGGQKSSQALGETANTHLYPSEKWHYNNVEGFGKNVDLTFVDSSGTGNYQLTVPPTEKDASLFVLRRSSDCPSRPPRAPEIVQRIDTDIGAVPTPLVHFKDLEAMAISRIVRDQLAFSFRTKFVKATHATTITRIIILIPDKQLASTHDSVASPVGLQIFARITKSSGWVTDIFERSTSGDSLGTLTQAQSDIRFDAATAPGVYRLAIVVKDIASGKTASRYASIVVPSYEQLGIKK